MKQIKEGYKQTKVGIIPEDWEVLCFDDLKDKTDKHSITGGPFGSDLKSEHYTISGVRVIQLQNIGDGRFINKEFVYTSKEKANQLKNCLIYPNEIILAKMAEPVARACLIPSFEDKFLMCSDGIRLLVDKNKFSTKYVLEYINYDLFRRIAIDRSTGSTRSRIGLSDLKTIPLALPPLKEQEKIAEILTTWDNAIIKQQELIKSKEEQKKGLMQKLLSGKVRFDGFSDEWEEVRLGEVAEVYQPQTISQTELTQDGYDVYGANGIIGKYYQYNHELEQIAVTCRGNTCGTVNYTKPKSWITGNAMVINLDNSKKAIKTFMYYLFLNTNFTYLISGSGQPQITGNIKSHKLELPSLEEQEKIAEVLILADEEINNLKNELKEQKQQKKALMQKLLTGQVRVKV